ncbi:adenylate/guanylate cyclase domain-containing protein [Kamptonema cortianum]|nr:adenylate/guanylate cyclase domain-containing protein [Geitlerinema splendidum]MDK3162284.1 adenylate/guanylate cyclase domain-containing protein [Kamptonema cortianum]
MSERIATQERAQAFSLIEEFIRQVREDPDVLTEPIDSISERFGLPPEFIESVLDSLTEPIDRSNTVEQAWFAVKDFVKKTVSNFTSSLQSITDNPLACLGGTTLFVVLYIWLAPRFGEWLGLSSGIRLGIFGSGLAIVLISVAGIQGLCYFRQAMARYPAIMAAVVWVLTTTSFVLSVEGGSARAISTQGLSLFAVMILAGGIVASIYSVFSFGLTVIGSFAQYRQADRTERRLSRQEMLDHLFSIDQRLANVSEDAISDRRQLTWVEVLRASSKLPAISFLLGLTLGSLEVLVLGTIQRNSGQPLEEIRAGANNVVFGLTALGFMVFRLLMDGFLGYIGGRPRKAIGLILVAFIGQLFAYLLPYAYFGPSYLGRQLQMQSILPMLTYIFALGFIVGLAALVESRNSRSNRISGNHYATLVAEKIRLQWRLNMGAGEATVLVVDVAKSTAMKANNDPLRIEWSFREYQNLVARVVGKNLGEVISTAGDGAVAVFASAESAVDAARQIQSEITKFNSRKNRLDLPFRLRIGIHCGRTEASVAEAPFNALIDIAAHVEKIAPVGGIAVTGAVAKICSDHVELAEMARQVDDQAVWVVLNPTMDV